MGNINTDDSLPILILAIIIFFILTVLVSCMIGFPIMLFVTGHTILGGLTIGTELLATIFSTIFLILLLSR